MNQTWLLMKKLAMIGDLYRGISLNKDEDSSRIIEELKNT
jgi:hypothetical protein